jgi:hypothetical protein
MVYRACVPACVPACVALYIISGIQEKRYIMNHCRPQYVVRVLCFPVKRPKPRKTPVVNARGQMTCSFAILLLLTAFVECNNREYIGAWLELIRLPLILRLPQ